MKCFHKASICLFLILLVRSCYSVDQIGGRNVTFIRQPQNWHTANEVCRSLGLRLLTLNNDVESEKAYQLARKYKPWTPFWLSASDIGHEGEFVWMSTGKKVISAQWGPGQPDNTWHDNARENCLEVTYHWNSPMWNDAPCHFKLVYFCETVPATSDCNLV